MDLKNKYDRLIVLTCLGIIVISCVFTATAVHKNQVKKSYRESERQQAAISETINIRIWRAYHYEQMILLKEILKELKKQNQMDPPLTTIATPEI